MRVVNQNFETITEYDLTKKYIYVSNLNNEEILTKINIVKWLIHENNLRIHIYNCHINL